MHTAPLLQTSKLTKHFGGLAAVSDVDLEIYPGEILGLIGPNGAGKTTVFNMLSGVLSPTHGSIRFQETEIGGRKPYEIAKHGIVRTFQLTTVFGDMTVLDNVLLGGHLTANVRPWQLLFSRPAIPEAERQHAWKTLEFTGLTPFATTLAKHLPHGQQRSLGIAIALAARPLLLLLDEPVAGMTAEEKDRVMDLTRVIRHQGVTVLLVEHDMRAVMGTCDRIVVLNFGRKIAEGSPEQIRTHPEVIEAYLGTEVQAVVPPTSPGRN
jgi:branched-chain amino acid transport system ATP-binding protein